MLARLRSGTAGRTDGRAAHPRLSVFLVGALLVGGLTAILSAPVLDGSTTRTVGRPSPSDVVAPRAVAYLDALRTDRERDRAAAAVAPRVSAIDPIVAGRQAQRARDVLAHIALVRADPFSTLEEKAAQLARIDELARLPGLRRDGVVDLPDAIFEQVQREVPIVVAQVLRQAITPDGLEAARSSVVSSVDRAMDPATAELVSTVAGTFVVPNTGVDDAATVAARQAARDAVQPIVRTIAAGETVVRRGDILTDEDMAALGQLGLLHTTPLWQRILGALGMVLATVGVSAGLLFRLRPDMWWRPRRLMLAAIVVLGFCVGAWAVVPEHAVLAYAYPAAAAAMGLAVLVGLETGIAASLIVAVVIGALAGANLPLAAYVLFGSLAGAVVLSRVERLASFVVAGLAVAAVTLAVVIAARLTAGAIDTQGFVELTGAAAAQAVLATGLAALGVLAAGSVFGVTTSLHLLELARPDNPLLRDLQHHAPGTYQHSIVLANLAESGAAAVGADVLLTRVGAYYHDIGKSLRPYFFIENQMGGLNPHDGLDPLTSGRIVISHVTDGASMARKARLPGVVEDFVWQHHGTTRVEYFYRRAAEAQGEEPEDDRAFRYPGPRPQSRETAIVMLADGAEAAVRAAGAEALPDVDRLVGGLFDRRLRSGQLDDSGLTLRDLARVRAAFVTVLQTMYHPRIRYPDDVPAPVADSQSAS